MTLKIARLYSHSVFERPKLVIVMLLALVVFFAWHAQNFRLDASADSLLLENDPDLEFSREINNRYAECLLNDLADPERGARIHDHFCTEWKRLQALLDLARDNITPLDLSLSLIHI